MLKWDHDMEFYLNCDHPRFHTRPLVAFEDCTLIPYFKVIPIFNGAHITMMTQLDPTNYKLTDQKKCATKKSDLKCRIWLVDSWFIYPAPSKNKTWCNVETLPILDSKVPPSGTGSILRPAKDTQTKWRKKVSWPMHALDAMYIPLSMTMIHCLTLHQWYTPLDIIHPSSPNIYNWRD